MSFCCTDNALNYICKTRTVENRYAHHQFKNSLNISIGKDLQCSHELTWNRQCTWPHPSNNVGPVWTCSISWHSFSGEWKGGGGLHLPPWAGRSRTHYNFISQIWHIEQFSTLFKENGFCIFASLCLFRKCDVRTSPHGLVIHVHLIAHLEQTKHEIHKQVGV